MINHFTEYTSYAVAGRPFIVDGKFRTTTSAVSDSSECTGTESSWIASSPIILSANSTHIRDIGLFWLQQAEAEHTSIASFARHTLQLISIGAPSDLLIASQAAALDEIEHAKLCYGAASSFIGQAMEPARLDVDGSFGKMNVKDILESVIKEGCIEETLSAIEAHFRTHYAKDLSVKKTLLKIAIDETRHAQLAWNTVKWAVNKYPKIHSFVTRTFEEEFKQLSTLEEEAILFSSPICESLEKDQSYRRFGALIDGDHEKIRLVGMKNVIRPVFNAGFDHFHILSSKINSLDISMI